MKEQEAQELIREFLKLDVDHKVEMRKHGVECLDDARSANVKYFEWDFGGYGISCCKTTFGLKTYRNKMPQPSNDIFFEKVNTDFLKEAINAIIASANSNIPTSEEVKEIKKEDVTILTKNFRKLCAYLRGYPELELNNPRMFNFRQSVAGNMIFNSRNEWMDQIAISIHESNPNDKIWLAGEEIVPGEDYLEIERYFVANNVVERFLKLVKNHVFLKSLKVLFKEMKDDEAKGIKIYTEANSFTFNVDEKEVFVSLASLDDKILINGKEPNKSEYFDKCLQKISELIKKSEHKLGEEGPDSPVALINITKLFEDGGFDRFRNILQDKEFKNSVSEFLGASADLFSEQEYLEIADLAVICRFFDNGNFWDKSENVKIDSKNQDALLRKEIGLVRFHETDPNNPSYEQQIPVIDAIKNSKIKNSETNKEEENLHFIESIQVIFDNYVEKLNDAKNKMTDPNCKIDESDRDDIMKAAKTTKNKIGEMIPKEYCKNPSPEIPSTSCRSLSPEIPLTSFKKLDQGASKSPSNAHSQ